MKSIKTIKGAIAIVDDEDYERVLTQNWFFDGRYIVANPWNKTTKKQDHIYLHRFILDTPKGMVTDHINNNPLDNRKSNLRTCSWSENARNRTKPKINKSHTKTSSIYKGVCFEIDRNKWTATIKINGKTKSLGYFDDEIKCAQKYDEYAKLHYGEFAKTNF